MAVDETVTELPPVIQLLADHLDAALAGCEDLQGLTFDTRTICATGANPGCVPQSLPAFANVVQRSELTAAIRVLTARERAEELAESDDRFKMVVGLFLGGTACLADAIDALSKPGGDSFETGDCPVTYLRSRAVIAEDAAGPCGFSDMTVGETFRIGGQIELGALMDLIATFLDTLDIHYEVFPDNDASALAEPLPNALTKAQPVTRLVDRISTAA